MFLSVVGPMLKTLDFTIRILMQYSEQPFYILIYGSSDPIMNHPNCIG